MAGYVSRRIKEHQNYNLQRLKAAKSASDKDVQRRKKYSVEGFWDEQIKNLAIRYPKFCQENTCTTSQIIQGLEKFPIQYWNNPGEKLGLEIKDIKVANFFYKSAYKVLEA